MNIRVVASLADLELRRAKQPGDERPHDVDALDAVEPCLAIRAKQDARTHLDHLAGDAKSVHAPRDIEPGDQDDQERRHHREHLQDDAVAHDVVHGIPTLIEPR